MCYGCCTSVWLTLACLLMLFVGLPAQSNLLLSYGDGTEDMTTGYFDDGVTSFTGVNSTRIFGSDVTDFWVYGNGYVQLGDSTDPSLGKQPVSFHRYDKPLLCAFWADWNFNAGNQGDMYIRMALSTGSPAAQLDLTGITGIVSAGLLSNSDQPPSTFAADFALIVTWVGGPYPGYDFEDDLVNIVQLVLASDSVLNETYVLYQYEDVEWINIWKRDAMVGYSVGDGVHFYEHPYSRSIKLFDFESHSNVGEPGRFMFRIDTICNSTRCVYGVCLDDSFCLCDDGYSGALCDTNADNCTANACGNGTCVDGLNGYVCVCPPGTTDDDCTDINYCLTAGYAADPCIDGTCVDGVTGYTCSCDSDATGDRCQTIIDECESCPCGNHGDCTMGQGYSCTCYDDYTGDHCQYKINHCEINHCYNGVCLDLINDYECYCYPGFTGSECETNVDDCNPGDCIQGTCVDGIDGYTCHCDADYTGQFCDEAINKCEQMDPCMYGICYRRYDEYLCDCVEGYTGKDCESILRFCDNSSCSGAGYCMDVFNGYVCQCYRGYTGTDCEIDVDDCNPDLCVNGFCRDGANQFHCDCYEGYSGDLCTDIMFGEGQGVACVHGFIFEGVACICDDGYTGISCQINVDDCWSSPCINGFCLDGITNFTCDCFPGYEGDLCETDKNDCQDGPCQHGGTCKDAIDGFICDCPDLILGETCDTDLRSPVGSWGAWGLWRTCTKLCDNGLQKRYRQCLREPCMGFNDQVQLCNIRPCKGYVTGVVEETELMGLTLETSKSELQIVEAEEMLKTLLADSLNEFCEQNMKRCCHPVNVTTPAVLTSGLDVFTGEDVAIAAGFPVPTDKTGRLRIKVLVGSTVKALQEACGEINYEYVYNPGVFQTVYMPLDVLHDAVQEAMEHINKDICCWQVIEAPNVNTMSYILMGTLIPAGFAAIFFLVFLFRSLRSSLPRPQKSESAIPKITEMRQMIPAILYNSRAIYTNPNDVKNPSNVNTRGISY